MGKSIKQSALDIEDKKSSIEFKNIVDKESVDVDFLLETDDKAKWPYSYFEENGCRYKVPVPVLRDLKAVLAVNPNLKSFKVTKTGVGDQTRYRVIPLA